MRKSRVATASPLKTAAVLTTLTVLSAAAFFGCSRTSFMGPQGRPLVVTSITPIGSIIRNVAGDRAQVEAIVPPGLSAYGYRLTGSDRDLVSRASAAFFNGMGYDDLLMADVSNTALLESPPINFSTHLMTAEASVPVTPAIPPGTTRSPFLWLDPLEARAYAAVAKDVLSRIDPDGAAVYQQNYDRFIAATQRIATAISETITSISAANRRVYAQVNVLDHYSARFGLETIGASQLFNSPSPDSGAVRSAAETLKLLSLPAVFGTAPSVTEAFEQIAREAGVKTVVMVRYQDLPGPPGSLSHTYFGLVIENTRLISQALGGSSSPLDGIRPNDSAPVP